MEKQITKMTLQNNPAKRPQILTLNPANEIVLEGPFDHVVTSHLELYNPSHQKVCFKVKTTAPKRYCVRPNCGMIQPDTKVKIAIMLQPIANDSQSERSKHKFMVQSIVVDDDSVNLDTIWTTANSEDIMDSKLRCVFQMPSLSEAPETSQVTTTTISAAAATTNNTTSGPTSSSTGNVNIQSSPGKREPDTDQPQLWMHELTPQKAQKSSGDGQQNISNEQQTSSPRKQHQDQNPRRICGTNQSIHRASNETDANKSVSFNNLTASFIQPMGDDYKLILLSLAMLFIGVLLGKYII